LIAGIDERLATPRQKLLALAGCTILTALALLGLTFSRVEGPAMRSALVAVMTILALAEGLTAYLLLAKFYVNGRFIYGILAFAYALDACLICFYTAVFPGLFRTSPLTIGDQQLMSVTALTWHSSYPILVLLAILFDSPMHRLVGRRRIRMATAAIPVLAGFLALAFATVALVNRDKLPHFIENGTFKPLFLIGILPLMVFISALPCIVVLARRQAITPLGLVLAAASFACTLEAIMVDAGGALFSVGFDVGKLIMVLAGSVVLLAMLWDIFGVYGQLAALSSTDALTALPNRRAFDEHFAIVFNRALRNGGSLGLILIDVDRFKHYNDSYGHLAGDACLRRVAAELGACATRPLDIVARYGGEEFAVLMPDTPAAAMTVIAERMRAMVERIALLHAQTNAGIVTVSLGVAHVAKAEPGHEADLFDAADRALYRAKSLGRNVVVSGVVEPRNSVTPEPQEIAVSSAL